MKNVLVVDSDQAMLQTLVGLLKSQGGFLNVLSAVNGRLALELIEQFNIHIIITGLRLPELDGFELVARLGKEHPEIRVIVMTHNASPMLRAKVKQIASAVHFDQALDIGLLTKRIFTELQIDYGGQVRGINLSSFLQMLQLEARSCTLQITAKGKYGYLWIQDGELIAAQFSKQRGKAAALQVLSWENVLIDIDYSDKAIAREISLPLMMLILESGQIDDEKQSETPNQRVYDRYDLLVALDYDFSDMTYQCFLRDISIGGAYIETEQRIAFGQTITLMLSSPALKRSCAIEGKVVRSDKKGIGMKFLKMSNQQKIIIQALVSGSIISPLAQDREVLSRTEIM